MLVSVVMICYNQEKYIRQSIESVLAQEGNFDLEIIVGDDASPDSTAQIVAELAEQDERIIPVLRKENFGMNRNFIDIVRRAKGKYIAILEGDDFWIDNRKLAKQVEILEANPDAYICYTDTRIIGDNDEFLRNFYTAENGINPWFSLPSKRLQFEHLINGNFISTASVMCRRIEDLDIPEWFYELKLGDWPFLLFHAERGDLICLDDITSCYRQHSASNWSSKSEIFTLEKTIECYYMLKSRYPNYSANIDKMIINHKETMLLKLIIECAAHFNNGDYEKANSYVEDCLDLIEELGVKEAQFYSMFAKVKKAVGETELAEKYLQYHNDLVASNKEIAKETEDAQDEDSQKDLPQLVKNLEEGNYEKALEISERLMDKLPRKTINQSNLHYSKALCLYKLGRYEEAYETIYAEIIINPDFEQAYELQNAIAEAMEKSPNLEYSNYKPERKEVSEDLGSYAYEVSIIIP
jgi:glycosyltransferase involved in cell wall biosynthesis